MVALLRQPTQEAARDATVGVGVVGYGYWGPNLVRNFFDVEGCRVESICDALPARLSQAERRHPSAKMRADFDDLLGDPTIDAVAIATPVSTHADLARRALEAGKHVLIEKPMTISIADAERLVELAAQRNLILMVDHTFVYTGAVRAIKGLLDTGALGNLYYYDSVRVNLGLIQRDVSVVWDLAAHDLSIMDFLLPHQPTSISTVAATHLPGGTPDVAYITVNFEDSFLAHFHVNWLSPVKVRQVLLGGDRQMVLYDDIEPTEKVRVYDRGIHFAESTEALKQHVNVAYRLGDMHAPVLDQTEALRIECQHFIDCVRTGSRPITDGLAGLRNVRLLEAAERSMRRGGQPEYL
jgi:predicted dehydrogenase